jgi:hypothetical protein
VKRRYRDAWSGNASADRYPLPNRVQEALDSMPRFGSERKRRLFAAACARKAWDLLSDERSRAAVEVAERFGEGLCTDRERTSAEAGALAVLRRGGARVPQAETAARRAAASASHRDPFEAAQQAAHYSLRAGSVNGVELIGFLFDLFGNPFREVVVIPAWLSRNEGIVARLSQSIYSARAFDGMPILADALEEVGCDDSGLINHCRSPRPHVLGCWALDALLGRVGGELPPRA